MFWRKIIRVFGILAVAFGLSYWVVYDFSSVSYFAPAEKASDFRLSDFYNIVADNSDVRELDPDVVIVSIDDCSRGQIAEAIEQIDYCAPRAVGLDLFFNYPSGDDEGLVGAIEACEGLVLPLHLVYDASEGYFRPMGGSFFYDRMAGKEFGAVNLAGNNVQSVIREFRPQFPCPNDTIPSFAAAIARKTDPAAYQRLLERVCEYEQIYYPSREFEVIPASEILDNQHLLHNKIVLVGTVGDLPDKHVTPIEYQMSGVMIHAYTISTILEGRYVSETSDAADWTVAVVLCLIIVAVNVHFKDKKVGNLLIRGLQIVLLYLIIFCGCHLFISRQICVDFTKPLLMVGLGLLASDIWFGAIGCWEWLRMKYRKFSVKK